MGGKEPSKSNPLSLHTKKLGPRKGKALGLWIIASWGQRQD